jgi:hypothetical protein
MGMIGVEGFPTTGWIEVEVEDLGKDEDDHQLCGYCGQEWVRYLHKIDHPDGGWPRQEVGCICAGKLTGDELGAKALDRAARNISARRSNWCTLKGWRVGRKGGLIIKKDGRIFALNCSKYGSWAGSWTGRGDDVWQRVDGWHRDLDAAKLALFDAVYGAHDTKEDEVAA